MPAPGPGTDPTPAPDTVGEVIRWAVFCCVLVPVVLLWHGTPPAGATGTALGLAALTAVCRMLLRRSERCRAPYAARSGGRHTRGQTPVD